MYNDQQQSEANRDETIEEIQSLDQLNDEIGAS